MTRSNAAVEALQNRHILQLMCHNAEQEIIFIDPLNIKLRRLFQRTVQHNMVSCAQFQIRQILCCCVSLFTSVVFDSGFCFSVWIDCFSHCDLFLKLVRGQQVLFEKS